MIPSFLKNAGDIAYIPKTLAEPCIEKASQTINEAALSPEELDLQEKLEMAKSLLDILDIEVVASKLGLSIE